MSTGDNLKQVKITNNAMDSAANLSILVRLIYRHHLILNGFR
jgi:hypothetical protein